MNKKEFRKFRKLSKLQLMELLLEQVKENERLTEENNRLNGELVSRQLMLSKVGNIAEASLIINKVFEAAQEAAELYLDNVKRIANDGN
ncbi:DNA repair protein [Streptococcus ovuberis]|uniref:DNA repair protein n=1 Tax=Streptococcus ovuberis TaxID=1936207 RepID=A0A7X6N395_9STRE|nr:DNA repair protein [Streptococcus ovuberis]NKZ21337.1 DNA repair protein [Streptococcus ovuberis]